MKKKLISYFRTLKTSITTYSVFISLLATLTVTSATLPQSLEPEGQTEEKMTDQQKILSWQGEKVVLLGPPYGDSDEWWYGLRYKECVFRLDKPEQSLPMEEYAGKTGTVIGFERRQETDPLNHVVIQLDDSNEKILVCPTTGDAGEPVGFFTEMSYAETLIGQSFWAIGQLTLYPDHRASRRGTPIKVANTSKLTVTRAEWGGLGGPIILYFNTEEGKEGYLRSNRSLVDRFSIRQRAAESFYTPYTSHFYTKDPRELFPGWSETIWKIIRKGHVAVGMSLEMAKVACAKDLRETGFVLLEGGEDAATLYKCSNWTGTKRFRVEKDKVVEYREN